MRRRIGNLGSSIDPGTIAHIRMAQISSKEMYQVRIMPCGDRPDKLTVNDTPAQYRGLMADIMAKVSGRDNIVADLSDLERERFSTTWEIDQRLKSKTSAEIWHIMGADVVPDIRPHGNYPGWNNGEQLWHTANFFLFTRPDYDLSKIELPPNSQVVTLNEPVSSSEVRGLVTDRKPYEHFLDPKIAEVVKFYELYRGKAPKNVRTVQYAEAVVTLLHTHARYGHPGLLKIQEQLNLSQKIKLESAQLTSALYLAAGGDGDLLDIVNHHWRVRKPILPINIGHVGFLLNDMPENLEAFATGPLLMHECPFLLVEILYEDGFVAKRHAFNDAYMKAVPTRDYDTTGWFEVKMTGEQKDKHLMGDGVLVCTAQGSTGYAFSAGGDPFRISDPYLRVIGLNTSRPRLWKSQMVSVDTKVTISNLDKTGKRPVRAFVDGRIPEPDRVPVEMRIKRSRVAFASLLFGKDYDFESKMRRLVTIPDFAIL